MTGATDDSREEDWGFWASCKRAEESCEVLEVSIDVTREVDGSTEPTLDTTGASTVVVVVVGASLLVAIVTLLIGVLVLPISIVVTDSVVTMVTGATGATQACC